ncbi:MAG: DUF1156 domain-containing protein, partial [Candidatus Korarchaeota archaeon]
MNKLFEDSAWTNVQVPEKAFIESYKFPWSTISEYSAVEKGPARPPHWEMVFWWTRKPLISARAIIAGSLLQENNSQNFLSDIGINKKSKAAHNNQPRNFGKIKLLDPFAGFGSIPLEAMRLGLETTAVELLPTPYVFLKAVLEFPRIGRGLVGDVEKWGKWITERLREDPLIKELYDENVGVYIGTWEIKCPHCGRWTPLIGNSWLAKVKDKKNKVYERLAWMEPVVIDDKVEIKIVELNRAVKCANVSKSMITINDERYKVPESNINARHEKADCLLCHQPIMHFDPQTGKHYTDVKNLPRDIKERLESYVKYAIKTYNQSLEGENIEVLARQRLLVKVRVKNEKLEFEPCTEKDQEKLELARKELETMLREGDPDIPIENLSPSERQHRLSVWVWGFNKFYKLFNPRQLLILVNLVRLIRKAGKKIEEEKRKEGMSREDAIKYAEAVTTFLAIALTKYVNYNAVTTHW